MAFKKQRYIFLSLIFLASFSFSQNIPLIHVKKPGTVIFFKLGAKSDTIVKNKSDLFYLHIPDSLKQNIALLTENGAIQYAGNDTLFKCVYLKGLKYESFYAKDDTKTHYVFKSLIDGASDFNANDIRIRVSDKKAGVFLLENIFVYKPQ